MILCDGGIKGGFGEGFNFGFDFWGDPGNKPCIKVEACAKENGFELGIGGGLDNVIFKFSL